MINSKSIYCVCLISFILLFSSLFFLLFFFFFSFLFLRRYLFIICFIIQLKFLNEFMLLMKPLEVGCEPILVVLAEWIPTLQYY